MNPVSVHPASVDPQPTSDQPMLRIEGIEDSSLKVTLTGLQVCQRSSNDEDAPRFWAYEDLRNLRIASYGPIGVVRATVRTTGAELPLLLLEPDQIVAARRTLEVVWNRIGRDGEGHHAA